MHKASHIVLGLVCVLVAVGCTAYAIVFIYEKTGSQVVVTILGIAGALVGAAYQFRLAKEKEAEARLFTEKQKVYSNLISTIFSIYQPEALKQKQPKDIEYARKFNEIRTSLIVWGSFETIKCLDSLSISDAELQLDPLKWGLKRQAALFAAIRKDLGHKDPDDAGLEIAIGAIKGDEREEVRTKVLK